MPEISFAHLCDYALISSDGKLSALGIFAGINVVGLPALHPVTFLAFELTARSGDIGNRFTLRIDVVDNDGGPILRMEKQGVLQGRVKAGEVARHPEVVRVPPLTLKTAGRHAINIILNGRLAHALEFDVNVLPAPPAPPAP